MPVVSAIIPNYNHAAFLKQRIESVLNQTFQNFELIILDDCSSDNSKMIIESYKDHPKVDHIFCNKRNSGSPLKQWQKGIELSTGEYVWIAESDDVADIHFLEKLVSVVERNSSIAMVYSQTYDIDEKGEIIESRIKWTNNFAENIWEKNFCIKGKDFLKYLYKKNVIPNASACLVRKDYIQSALIEINEVNDFRMCGDWFTWLLIANQPSVSIAFVSEHLNYFRDIHQSTRNHNSKKKLVNRLLEEAKIFNSAKFEIDKNSLQQKNKSLGSKWIHLFSNQAFSLNFFKIGKFIGISRYSLLKNYLKVKR